MVIQQVYKRIRSFKMSNFVKVSNQVESRSGLAIFSVKRKKIAKRSTKISIAVLLAKLQPLQI